MDPGTILAILGACSATLTVLGKLKDAFTGDETSRAKLSELEARLITLNHVLERTSSGIPSFLANHPTAPDELRRTIESCNALFREYEHVARPNAGAKGVYQRGKLAVLDGDKLDRLHERLNRHVLDLQAWHLAEMSHAAHSKEKTYPAAGLAVQRCSMSAPPQTVSHESGHMAVPDRSFTVVSGETLFERSSEYDTTAAITAEAGRWAEDSIAVEAPRVAWAEPTLFPSNNPWADNLSRERVAETQRASAGFGQILSALPSAALAGADGGLYPASVASSVSATSAIAGEVKIITARGSFTFTADNYAVSPAVGAQEVQWTGETCTLTHYVPLDNSGIPFTRPTDKKDDKKENRLHFMPFPAVQHKMRIRMDGEVEVFRDSPQYMFQSRRERQRFQEAIHGSCKMQSFRGLTITTNLRAGKALARDVNIKIWTFDDPSRGATISFARNLDNQEHDEIPLRCFENYKDAKKDSNTVTLRVRKPEGLSEPTPTSRRHSFLGSARRGFRAAEHRDSSSGSADPSPYDSRRSSTNSVASVDGAIDLPEGLKKLEWLKVEFDDKRVVRAEFCKAFADAYGSASMILAIPGQSPSLLPQGGATSPLSTSPVLLSSATFPHTYGRAPSVSPSPSPGRNSNSNRNSHGELLSQLGPPAL
ncbi:hypothetical protein QBC46DRAFT_388504 [Diplogelasinospora grovesii]|uniref:Uncharacterized protein n=1 Tax=Diplogelasinospora grovesii TaxID=303347 RepID=A0AAN6S474_9PEZI|nr:hypothetical protein QBC46DRAFT_388504 [Diplogelasinospora grovesii]